MLNTIAQIDFQAIGIALAGIIIALGVVVTAGVKAYFGIKETIAESKANHQTSTTALANITEQLNSVVKAVNDHKVEIASDIGTIKASVDANKDHTTSAMKQLDQVRNMAFDVAKSLSGNAGAAATDVGNIANTASLLSGLLQKQQMPAPGEVATTTAQVQTKVEPPAVQSSGGGQPFTAEDAGAPDLNRTTAFSTTDSPAGEPPAETDDSDPNDTVDILPPPTTAGGNNSAAMTDGGGDDATN